MTYDLKGIDKAADYVIAHAKCDILLFDAPMGSGKTTLIGAICKKLGVNDPISSPTFGIVNEYVGKSRKIHHFDLYRINSIDELYDIGVEDYLDTSSLKLIEWPETVIPLITDYQFISINSISNQTREIRVSDVVRR